MFESKVDISWEIEKETNDRKGTFVAPNNRTYVIVLSIPAQLENKTIEERVRFYEDLVVQNNAVIEPNVVTALKLDRLWDYCFYDKEDYEAGKELESYEINGAGSAVTTMSFIFNIFFQVLTELPNSVLSYELTEPSRIRLYKRFSKRVNMFYQELKNFEHSNEETGFEQVIWFVWAKENAKTLLKESFIKNCQV